jgi:hypothetical protein
MFMVACIRKQQSMAGGEDAIMELSCGKAGHMDFVDAGTTTDNIDATMKGLGVTPAYHDWDWSSPGSTKINPGSVWGDHPALVLVGWYAMVSGKRKRQGGHYVVARWFTDDCSKIVYLDPWKGQLVELINNGKFKSMTGSGLIEWVMYT